MTKWLIRIIGAFAVLQFIFATLAFLGSGNNPPAHGILGMGLGLFIFWIFIGGFLMWKLRDPLRALIRKLPGAWWFKFIVSATAFAMIEEAITTAMTNAAPLFGVTAMQVHITASANYWDVVLTNSVVLFVPMFCIWAWILSRYDVSPSKVFLLWGLTGTILETIHGGPQQIIEIGMWVFVYGLMIFIPAYALPEGRVLKQPSWWQKILFIFVPILGVIPGGILAAIFKAIWPPHYFPDVS